MVPNPLIASQVTLLEANRARFIRFVSSKVGDPQLAEDLLQTALLRAMQAPPQDAAGEAVVAWFMAVLKNAIVDFYRRRASAGRAVDAHAADAPEIAEAELKGAVCGCVRGVVDSLKPEYAEILAAVELDEHDLAGVAARLGITPNNARVRLHRARSALKQELLNTCRACASHGCLDCSCHGSKPAVTLTSR